VATILSAVPSSVFVVDCGANMSPQLIAANAVPFVQVGARPGLGLHMCWVFPVDKLAQLPIHAAAPNPNPNVVVVVVVAALAACHCLPSPPPPSSLYMSIMQLVRSSIPVSVPIVIVEPADYRPACMYDCWTMACDDLNSGCGGWRQRSPRDPVLLPPMPPPRCNRTHAHSHPCALAHTYNGTRWCPPGILGDVLNYTGRRSALQAAYSQLQDLGVPGLVYVNGSTLYRWVMHGQLAGFEYRVYVLCL
jgi:hypothetical protein